MRDESVFNVVWTCSEQEFLSQLAAEDVVAWHFYGREKPSWLSKEKYDRAADCSFLFATADDDDSSKKANNMTNFDLPADANDIFPWVDDERDGRWWTTLACLNDPKCASHYDPTGKMAYPLPLLLTIIVICREFDETVKLPMIITSDKKAVFKLADKYARRLNQSGPRLGYRELEALEQIVDSIDTNPSTDEEWRKTYQQCEAVILTLSEAFERDNDSWTYADDPPRIHEVCAELVSACLGAVLLNAPSEATKQWLSKDIAHISQHLNAGNFVQFVEDGDFAAEFPVAAKTWEQLTQLAN